MSDEWYPGQAYVHKHNANIKRAEETAMARNQDYKTDLYADLRDFDKAVEYVRACAIEGALDIALRDVLAANRPQASSEVRKLIKEWRAKADYESARWNNQGSSTAQERIDAVGDYYADALEKALAPSRQGAGGV